MGEQADAITELNALVEQLRADVESEMNRLRPALELLREVYVGDVGWPGGLEHSPKCYAGTDRYDCGCGLGAWLEQVKAVLAQEEVDP